MKTGNNRSHTGGGLLALVRNQRGAIMVMVAGLVMGGGILCFCILAIDAPILMTTKTQLQNAADAAALGGAPFYLVDSSDEDQTARDIAKSLAAANFAVQDSIQPVIIGDADVTFPVVYGRKRIEVRTHRTVATNDPLKMYFLRLPFASNTNLADVQAVAAAEQYDVCAVQCVKPWAIPDRWDDADGDGFYTLGEDYDDLNDNGVYDFGEPFDDDNLDGVREPDEFYDPLLTGYLAPGDVGSILILHSDATPGTFAPGQYFSIDLPPIGYPGQDPLPGGDYYRQWIAECAPYYVSPGDSCLLEPGLMVGPTTQGCRDLIALDPGAYWDPVTQQVVSDYPGLSPRIIFVPFFDPLFGPHSGKGFVRISKIGAFFIEGVQGNGNVTARFIEVAAPGEPCEEQSQAGSFFTSIRLVK
jgi:hypothetical protein